MKNPRTVFIQKKKSSNARKSGQPIPKWSLKKTVAYSLALPLVPFLWTVQNGLSRIVPVRKNRVTLFVPNIKGFACNPKYVAEALRARYPGKYEFIWATRFPEEVKKDAPEEIRTVKAGSFAHFKAQFTSRVLISNDYMIPFFFKRKDQLYINTWHACMNYKRIGYDSLAFSQKIQEKEFALKNCQPDAYISGSRFFTENTADSFKFDKNIFKAFGMPRNDMLFGDSSALKSELREKLGLPGDAKTVLYAPTFRTGIAADDHNLNAALLVRALSQRFGGDWVILYRSHYFIKEKLENSGFYTDVTGYSDMQELLCFADVLVSDYSSCLWDFSLTKKPAFVYAPDIEDYKKDRSFAYPPEKWPFSIALSNEELSKNILNFDEEKYLKDIEAHHKDAGSYDDGSASSRVAEMIDRYCPI